MSLCVLIILKPELARFGLKALLNEIDPNVVIVETHLRDGIVNTIEKEPPHLLIADFSLFTRIEVGQITDLCSANSVAVLGSRIPSYIQNMSFECIDFLNSVESIKDQLTVTISRLKEELGDVISEELTLREKDIIRDVAMGLSSKEIADKNFISPHTVITHRKNITRKLGIKSISGLTIYAIINKLINVDDVRDHE